MNVEIVVLNCQKCNQCLEGHKFLGLFFEGVVHLSLSFSFSLYLSLSLYFCWSGHISVFVFVIVNLLVLVFCCRFLLLWTS